MSDHDLSAVGKRLEAAVIGLSSHPVSASELYELYEMVAIQVLDSEHACHPQGVLEAYLKGFLDALPLPR